MTVRPKSLCLRSQARTLDNGQRGNSTVEFIGAAAGLLIPALLLIVAVVRVQSATFAAQSGAQEVARTYSLAREISYAHDTANAMADLAFQDQGLAPPSVSVTCPTSCLTPGDLITVRIDASVPILTVGTLNIGAIPVQATANSYLGKYVDRSGR